MSKKRVKRRKKILLLALVLIAICAAAGWFLKQEKAAPENSEVYKTEKVKRGSVSTGISEDGTVELGTTDQVFTVAEITEVSALGTDSSEDSTGTTSNTTGGTGTSNGAGGAGTSNGAGGTGSAASPSGTGSSASPSGTGISSSGTVSSGESTSLVVEEVYVATGQQVQQGDKILKITQDSIDEYRSQLEAAVKNAELKVSQEEINVESKKAEADYTYEMYLAEGETAEETYNATITSLETAVSDLEEELEEAQADGDEDEIEGLEAELQIAKNNLTTKSIEAKQVYENAMTNYKYAQQLYDIDTNGLEDDLNDAKEVLAEAQQNLEDFEKQIGDGIVYALYSGTVTQIAYGEGDALASDSVVVSYTDSDNVTMTVSVSQEDISQIAVGDETSVNLTAYEGEEFSGEVASISVSTSSGSATVNYDVVVRFTGDMGKIYSGMTGEATFAGKTVEDTLYISNKAVFQEGTKSYVKVQTDDGSICQTEIKTGFSNGTIVAVESGLEEGQTVIIESKVVR